MNKAKLFTPADRVTTMKSSSTLAVLQQAERLRREGHDVIDFGPGEPDFPTPENIKHAAHLAIDENFTRYTPTAGTVEMKKAIIDYFTQETGHTYQPAQVIAGAGGKQTIFNAIITLINPGDEVLLPAPYWVTFPEIVHFAGGKPVAIETEQNHFQLTAEMVAEKITPKTKLLVLNSPSNPSGRVITDTEFAKIVELAAKHDFWVMSDECYYQFVYPPHKPFTAASLPAELRERVMISGSFSKTYAMTGWRIGYALGNKDWIAEMLKVQSHSTSNPSSIGQRAAIEAATGPQGSVSIMLSEYQRRRDYLIPALNKIPGFSCVVPEGAFYAFPSVKALFAQTDRVKNSDDIAQYLLEKAHVVLTSGEAFGSEGYLRISYATSMETIQKGVQRIENSIRQLLEK